MQPAMRLAVRRAASISIALAAVVWSACFAQSAAPAATPSSAAAAQSSPDQLIQSVAQQMLSELDAHRAQLKSDPEGVHKLVDTYMLPHFDTEYAARLVLGKNWRDASAEQRKRFVDAFYKSLLKNYGQALLGFTADRLKVLPYQGAPNADSATVRTEIRRDNGTAVPVNYTLHKTADGWKAWDVVIEGISYVRSFRTDFEGEIQKNGLDAVIQHLEAGATPQAIKSTQTASGA